MDINLHSFILVVGLIVILFIVIDGIKKVRDSRSSQFSDDVLDNDIITSEIHEDNHDEASFQEYEIADDLVKGSFVTERTDDSVHGDQAHEYDEQFDQNTVTFDDEFNVEKESPQNVASDSSATIKEEDSIDDVEETDVLEYSRHDTTDIENTDSLDALESFSASDDFSDVETVLPVVKKTEEAAVHPRKVNVNQPSKAEVESLKRKLERAQNEQEIPHIEPLTDLPKSVPVLMEPVELGREVDPNPPLQQEMVLPEFVTQTLKEEAIVAEEIEPEFDSFSIDDIDELNDEQILTDVPVSAENEKVQIPVGEKLSERAAAQEIFVINVLNENGPLLKGAELHHIFKACDMRHGEMDIFHRFEESNGQGKIQFSVVNALKPGTFDLNTIDSMETKGISMFMSLPGPEDAMGAFDAMAEVALVFAKNFGASLYDESHSDLTPQTLEHYRNRIREYSRKHFSRK